MTANRQANTVSSPEEWTATTRLVPGQSMLIEASAGTGKTFQTEGLTVRLVCGLLDNDGEEEAPVPIDKLLIITFTRAAAAELRDRVRRRLVQARDALVPNASGALPSIGEDDEVLTLLQSRAKDPEKQKHYRDLLIDALSAYDQATISTIHSFCQEMLSDYGLAAGIDPSGLELASDTQLATRVTMDIHAALIARCSVDEVRHLQQHGWSEGGLVATVIKNATKFDVQELRPKPPKSPEVPTVSSTAQRLLDTLHEALAASAQQADALQAWFETTDGQQCLERLNFGPHVNGFKHWNKPEDPVRDLCHHIATRGLHPGPQDVAQWLPSLIGKAEKDHAAEEDSPWARSLDILQAIQTTLTEKAPTLLAIALPAVHQIVAHRRQQRGLQTFDSMVRDLANALDREHGEQRPLLKAIRSRFRVALVDEFQDTDTAQWAILRKVFIDDTDARHRLIAVGDPKQSIYRFRGANLGVYDEARSHIVRTGAYFRLPKNFRSDAGVMEAVNTLFTDEAWPPERQVFPRIGAYEPVKPRKTGWTRIQTKQGTQEAPLELRWIGPRALQPADAEVDLSAKPTTKPQRTALTVKACALRIAQMLKKGHEVQIKRKGAEEYEAANPSDFAVLVGFHDEAAALARALDELGIPSIRRDESGVFSGSAATWLHLWLQAVASPRNERAARALAVSPLMGWSHKDLDTRVNSDAAEWNALRAELRSHGETWRTQGFARRFQRFLEDHEGIHRVRSRATGDVDTTDLVSLIDICDAATRIQRLSPAGLRDWVTQQQAEKPDRDSPNCRTVPTDAQGVVLSTLFSSKGLQYPIVLVPFPPKSSKGSDSDKPIRYSEDAKLLANVYPKGHSSRALALEKAHEEERNEDMRKLYVELTRAAHKVVVWGNDADKDSALARLLSLDSPVKQVEDLPIWPDKLDQIGAIRVDEVDLLGTTGPKWKGAKTPATTTTTTLVEWTGTIPRTWQNASYSSLAGQSKPKGTPAVDLTDPDQAPAPGDGSSVVEDDQTTQIDERTQHEAAQPTVDQTPSAPFLAPVAWSGAPQGASVGSWVHGILEDVRFEPEADGNYESKQGAPLAELMAERAREHGVSKPKDPAAPDLAQCAHQLVAGLLEGWLTTPLDGPGLLGLRPDFTLSKLTPADRIDELSFELRVGTGHGPTLGDEAKSNRIRREQCIRAALEAAAKSTTLNERTKNWVTRLLARTNPTKGTPTPVLTRFDGFLNGKIDLVFRAGEGDQQRYYVADYKTNALSGTDDMKAQNQRWAATDDNGSIPRLRRWHYTRAVMAWSMDHSAYHLQSLLYTVALHRFLEARLDGYAPETHLGGHLYLYLRGMEGEDTLTDGGSRLGVWTDRWPPETVVAISNALQNRFGGAQ